MKTLLKSFTYAITGIRLMLTGERNFRIHIIAMLCVIAAGIIFSISQTEWCIIIIAIGCVLTAEALNSAIEKLSDVASPGYNELIKKVKDIAAGAVLMMSVAAAIVGLIIFIPKIFG